MKKEIKILDEIIQHLPLVLEKLDKETLLFKKNEQTWSKQEILGHLIDSAIHNLVRFTEANYSSAPYFSRSYKQNELVEINNYQNADLSNLLLLWKSLNIQIIRLFENQNPDHLQTIIHSDSHNTVDLEYIMKDYVVHLQHHFQSIIQS